MPNCQNCNEKCPQAEMAHNAALGRMYATNEFISLLKKVESGQLVEVVRCKDCKYFRSTLDNVTYCICVNGPICPKEYDFCSYSERKDGGGNG